MAPYEIEERIIRIRGHRVLLDADLAALYGVPTRRLNEQVKRNRLRFPSDFVFKLERLELDALNRSQIATGLQKHRDPRHAPWAFTEHGALMAANVLSSRRAVDMSVYVVRAFVKLRESLQVHRDLMRKLAELEQRVGTHDTAIGELVSAIRQLAMPPAGPPKRRIGFRGEGA
jgi:hypothetical protein